MVRDGDTFIKQTKKKSLIGGNMLYRITAYIETLTPVMIGQGLKRKCVII